LNKLHQRGSKNVTQLLGIVDDEEKVEGEIGHIRLYFHLTVYVLYCLDVENRILLRINDYKHVSDSLFSSLLEERLDHILVHFTIGYDDAQLSALSV